jgi:flagellar biosynthetic protein FliR
MIENLLVSHIFTVLLVFSRVGTVVMLIPGIGEAYVSPVIRLLLALALSVMVSPMLTPYMPPVPGSPLELGVLLSAEVLTGAMIGGITRIMISTMHTTGMIIAAQSSLGAAMMFDINQASQGSSIGNLMSLSAVVLIFVTDMHHILLRGLFQSYDLFTPGIFPPVEDFANYVTQLVGRSFEIAVHLSAPHLLVGLVIYTAGGVMSRLMPTMQVFFIIIPAQLMLSFLVLMVTFTAMMTWFFNHLQTVLGGFVSP